MKKRKKIEINKHFSLQIDFSLFLAVILLSLFGLLIVYDASVIEAYRNFSDKYYFVKQQIIWTMTGIVIAAVISLIPYRFFKKISVPAFSVLLLLLFLTLLPSIGLKVMGAKRWLSIAGFRFQPAEFMKLALSFYLASYLEKQVKLPQFLFIMCLLTGLVMLEPDLGTTLVLSAIGIGMFFLSGAPLLTLACLLGSALLAVLAFIFTSQYRMARLTTFLNPTRDPLGASYHIRQILIALGSGGLFGVGIGKSRQKYEYIPAATTDSIFSIMAEEIGFMGSLLVILVFVFIIIKAFQIAKRAPDRYSQLLSGGIAIWLSVQILINLATMVALVPLTGIPLPFISYGGSSTIAALTGVGVLLSISRYTKVK